MPVRFSQGLRDKIVADLLTTYAYGTLVLFAGTQPTSSNDDESGYTVIAIITLNGAAFTPGQNTNGLNFTFTSNGRIDKAAGETWQGNALVAGTVGWGRFYTNAKTTGASTTGRRIDFNAATSGAPLTMANTTVAQGATITIDTCYVSLPE